MSINLPLVIERLQQIQQFIIKNINDNTSKYRVIAYSNVINILEIYTKKYNKEISIIEFKNVFKEVLTGHMMEKIININTKIMRSVAVENISVKTIIKEYLKTISGVGTNNIDKIYNSIIEYDNDILHINNKNIKYIHNRVDKFLISDSYTGNQQIKAEVKYKPLKTIPREIIDEINVYLQIMCKELKDIKKTKQIIITGSYRRELSTSSDIDVLLCNLTYYDLSKHLAKRKCPKLNTLAIYADGEKRVSTISSYKCFNGDVYIIVMDYFHATDEDFAFQLLYTTGSKHFNINMRKKAKDKGYTLNQYKIERNNNNVPDPTNVSFADEKSIFDFLNISYIEPRQRSLVL